MDIPGHGVMKGLFDLRDGVQEYLGKVDFNGKRVLEMGTADGFLCFYMESKGADVVAYDLSEAHLWDIVPFYNIDHDKCIADIKKHARELNNAFWLCHRALNSKANMVYGTVYTVPREIGMVDISTFGAILLHVRDPFLALQNALRLTRETVIITDDYADIPIGLLSQLRFPALLFGSLDRLHIYGRLRALLRPPVMKFIPKTSEPGLAGTWWNLSPECIRRMLAVLGFEKVSISYHWQKAGNSKMRLYTLVGHRTQDHYNY
jgi:hypothetical protein